MKDTFSKERKIERLEDQICVLVDQLREVSNLLEEVDQLLPFCIQYIQEQEGKLIGHKVFERLYALREIHARIGELYGN